jgi:hypothetical protein
MKTKIRSVLISAALICSAAALRDARAVSPPPDGGYPNFTTAEGTNALKNLTTGAANTAVGWFSLFGDTTASFNTGVGAGTLLFNNGDQNTAVGVAALLSNTTGSFNTATGVSALSSNTTGVSNNAFGWGALLSNTTGSNNTAIGVRALQSNTEGVQNVAVGETALSSNIEGTYNTAIGVNALFNNATGTYNTAIGVNALFNNSSGHENTALGHSAGISVTTASNVIAIGTSVSGENVSNTCYIGNIFGVTSAVGTAVFINSAGRLGTTTSSRRFKEEIKPMDKASETLFALQPVSFHYKKEIDPEAVPQFGLVAEDVEKVSPDLVVRDAEGKVNTVRYDQVNAMLLNEFLKEHRKVEEQQSKIEKQEATIAQLKQDFQASVARQQKQIEAHTAGLQKVSAQIEVLKPAPQMVENNP